MNSLTNINGITDIQMHNQSQMNQASNTTSQNYQGILQQVTSGHYQQNGLNSGAVNVPNYQFYPYYIQQGTNYKCLSAATIEQVENGWLIKKDGKCWIAEKKEDIIQHI